MCKLRFLKSFIFRNDIAILESIPVFIGFFVIFLWGEVLQKKMGLPYSKTSNEFVVGLAFFIWSISFGIAIWKREIPQIVTLSGVPAIIVGVIGLLLCWFLGFGLIIKAIGLLN
jgi:hypothetical protein